MCYLPEKNVKMEVGYIFLYLLVVVLEKVTQLNHSDQVF